MSKNKVVELFKDNKSNTLGEIIDKHEVENAFIFSKNSKGGISAMITSDITIEDLLVMEKLLQLYTSQMFQKINE